MNDIEFELKFNSEELSSIAAALIAIEVAGEQRGTPVDDGIPSALKKIEAIHPMLPMVMSLARATLSAK